MQRDYDLLRGWQDAAAGVPFTVHETADWREGYCLHVVQRTARRWHQSLMYGSASLASH